MVKCDVYHFIKNNDDFFLHNGKLTKLLLFETNFPKRGPTYRRLVLYPRHQTPQGN